jgi:uncharacterized protein (DUF983 family)
MNTQNESDFPVTLVILLVSPLITYLVFLNCGYPLWAAIVGMIVTPFVLMALYHYIPKLIIIFKERFMVRGKSK